MYLRRLAFTGVASVLVHLVVSRLLAELPERPPAERARTLYVSITSPPPPPPPPEPPPDPPAELAPTPPPPDAVPRPRTAPPKQPPRHQALVASDLPPSDAPPTERPALVTGPAGLPVFGLSLESTSSAGTGPSMPVGNTLLAGGKGPPGAPALPPAPAYEVTKMPLPVGRCTGRYTEAARSAAIEGTVVLDLIVGEDGRAREIVVTQSLGHGLDEAAIAAVQGCRFSPGERGRVPVPVRVRGFKIRFFLQGAE